MKIGIIGNYGATNIGDEAILSAIIRQLSDHEITVFSANPGMGERSDDVKMVPIFPLGIRSFFKYGLRRSIKALKRVDVVVLGGGGLFQDNHLYACFLWAWQIFWVKRYRKPLYIYATGVGPLNTWIGKKLTKWAYDLAEVITVRDDYSHHVLKSIGIKKEVLVTADPVFSFQLEEKEPLRTKNLFLISLRPWLDYKHQILESFAEFLDDLKREKGAEFVFVCMQRIKESDLKMINPLLKKVGGELCLVKNFDELLNLMQKAEFAVGMRYHFMIAALLTQTPLIPLSYGPKTENLFADSDLKHYVIKFDDLTPYKLKSTYHQLSSHAAEVAANIQALKAMMASKAGKNQEYLNSFLNHHSQRP